MVSEAIILAGGLGTRLYQSVPDRPKSLAIVNGKAFIDYLLDLLIKKDITKIILAIGHKSEMLIEHFRQGYKNLDISFALEDKPLGTGGAIVNALSKVINSKFLILNGDSISDFDFGEINNEFKLEINAVFVENTSRYGTLDTQKNLLKSFREKEASGSGLINSGIYRASKEIFADYQPGVSFSFEKDFIPDFLQNNPILVKTSHKKIFIDIGTPEDYLKAQEFFKKGEFE